jgi:hypothetical protein
VANGDYQCGAAAVKTRRRAVILIIIGDQCVTIARAQAFRQSRIVPRASRSRGVRRTLTLMNPLKSVSFFQVRVLRATTLAVALLGAGTVSLAAASANRVHVMNGATPADIQEAVLFAFDHFSIQFTQGLRLHLVSGKTPGQPNPIVLGRGKQGEPDDESVRFYGTVIREGEELRMWYLARSTLDHDRNGQLRVCLAISRDGLVWTKPKLGLVEFNGSKANNIVNIRGGRCEFAAIPIICDPADPDSERRYKMCFESWCYANKLAVAFSPDGLNWTEPPNNPVGPNLEHTGLIRFGNCYFVNGHGGSHFGWTRKMVTHVSYDFELWSQGSALSFRRDRVPPRQIATEWNSGEEVHLGAGLWHRGNVIIGVYDMWHGSPSSDRLFVGMDLGLVISNNALQYHEPLPDFRLVPAYEELIDYSNLPKDPGPPISANEQTMRRPMVRAPSLSHGQGMENLGDKTFVWYEVWGVGDVRVATWMRDRLGCFKVYSRLEERPFRPHNPDQPKSMAECTTVPMRIVEGTGKVFLNVGGLSGHSEMIVEVLDEQLRPIPGYSGGDCIPVRESGLRVPVRWRGHENIMPGKSFRLKITFGGVRPEDAELYAIYVTG